MSRYLFTDDILVIAVAINTNGFGITKKSVVIFMLHFAYYYYYYLY